MAKAATASTVSFRILVLLAALCLILTMGCGVKPKPFKPKDLVDRLLVDKSLLFAEQEPIKGPLSLSQCIARALVYNFDNKLAIMETVLQSKQLSMANAQMLPRLALDAGFNVRNNELASSSISYRTREQTLEPSVSTDQAMSTGDLSLTWSILDLGVSYFQAKQQSDRYNIAMERRRRVVSNIVKEVISAYWRAATAQRMLPKIGPAIANAEKALQSLQEQEKQPLQPVLTILDQQKGLLQLISQLRKINSDLSLAKAQLAALINLTPGQDFAVKEPRGVVAPPKLDTTLCRLETLGLYLRPDLREEQYQERIDRNNVWKEIVKQLPGVSIVAGTNLDSNSFLVNHFWAEAGTRFAGQLLNLVQAPKAKSAAKAAQHVTQTRRVALTMAAIIQINVSYQQYMRSVEAFDDAQAVNKIEEKIVKTVNDTAKAEVESEVERVRREASAISSGLERDHDLAEAYRSLGNLYFAVGADIVPANLKASSVDDLANAVEEALQKWQTGNFGELPKELTEHLTPEGCLIPLPENYLQNVSSDLEADWGDTSVISKAKKGQTPKPEAKSEGAKVTSPTPEPKLKPESNNLPPQAQGEKTPAPAQTSEPQPKAQDQAAQAPAQNAQPQDRAPAPATGPDKA